VAENIDTHLRVAPMAMFEMKIIYVRWQSLQYHVFWHYMLAFHLHLMQMIHRHDYKMLFCETGTAT
jgi:hypothetical protein